MGDCQKDAVEPHRVYFRNRIMGIRFVSCIFWIELFYFLPGIARAVNDLKAYPFVFCQDFNKLKARISRCPDDADVFHVALSYYSAVALNAWSSILTAMSISFL